MRRGDEVIDPFVGTAPTADCSPGQQPLWTAEVMAQLAYRPVLLTNANFATAAPQKEDVRRGWHQPTTLPVTIPALILWAEGYWLEPGDRVRFQVFGPKGYTLVDHAIAIEQGQQRWLGFAGTPRHGPQWPAGTYAGKVVLERATGDGAQRITLSPSLELRELP